MFKHPNFSRLSKYLNPVLRAVATASILLVGLVSAFLFLEEPFGPWSLPYCLGAMVVFLPSIDYWSRVVKDWLP